MARTFRETPDVAAATARMIKAIGRRVGEEQPESIGSLQVLQDALDDAWRHAIAEHRRAGMPDREVAAILGITRQAVQWRWPWPKEDERADAEVPVQVDESARSADYAQSEAGPTRGDEDV